MGINFEQPWALLVLLLPLAWQGWSVVRGRRQAGAHPPLRNRLSPTSATLLRAAIVLALTLALAGASITYPARHQAVMFVADLSTSTAAARTQMADFIKSALVSMPSGDLAGVLAVGESAQLETPVSAGPVFGGFTAVVEPDHTDLERGLRLGAALLPAEYRRRLVLISDGRENVGNAMAEVERLRQRGFTVDVVNLAPAQGAEALIKSIDAPGAIQSGERLDLTLTLTSTVAQKGVLRLYEERTLLESRTVSLTAGDIPVKVSMEKLTPGYHRIWAVLEAERDTESRNNESTAMVDVQGAPSVLVVEGFPGTGTNIRRALESTGMMVETRTPDGLPTFATQLARYSTVVLVDVPAPMIRYGALDALTGFVKQSGHGLVVIGGENSYAMGGYAGTPLESLLPVSMDVPQRSEKPPVAVALIIESFESQEKVNLSKEAGKGLVDLLTDRDYIMVSDGSTPATWAVPPQRVTDKPKIKALIDAMDPRDPPTYLPEFDMAAVELARIDAKVKHIVLAGDGDAQQPSDSEYYARVAQTAARGITFSAVHVNMMRPEEQITMQMIAQAGHGRYYYAGSAAAVPQIFLKEAQEVARPAVVEEDFIPGLVSRSPIVQGIEQLPMLRGYVATTPRPTGEIVLQSAQGDPILATWQAGLGRVAAFTSDAGGLWSEQMVRWPEFNRFWAGVVSWSMPPLSGDGLRSWSSVVGGTARLTVQLPEGEGAGEGAGAGGGGSWPANLTAGIIRPDSSTQVASLQAIAPGLYEGEVPASLPGPYLVKLSAGPKRQSVQLGETVVVVPYSPEFAAPGSDPGFMKRLAVAGGGQELADPAEAFAPNLPPARGRLPLAQPLLALAILLWLPDIAVRRLAVSAGEIGQALRRRWAMQSGGASGSGSGQAEAWGPLAALRKSRQRRAEAVARPEAVGRPDAVAKPTRESRPGPAGTDRQEGPGPAGPPEPGRQPAPKGEDGSFTQRLLEARRNRKK